MTKPLSVYRIHKNNYSIKNLKEYVVELENWIKKNVFTFKDFTFFHLRYYLLKLRIKLFLRSLLGV